MDTTSLLTIQPGEPVQIVGRIFGAPFVRRGKTWLPVAVLLAWGGLPRLVYHNVHDAQVTPQQHMARAAGGPLLNGLLWLLAALLRRSAVPGSLLAEMADIAVYTNALIACGGLLPLPPLDGGALLKWGLVAAGRSPGQADQIVRAVNGPVGVGLAGATALAVRKRRWLPAFLLAQFTALCLSFAFGWLKEN
jgi:hypothetical protein